MSGLFSGRGVGLASITAGGLILINQLSQLILPLTISESSWDATQSLRFGLALVAMFILLLALTGLYWGQAHVIGGLGLVGYLTAFLGTLLVAGDWWYETFITPVLMDRVPELLEEAPSGSILLGAAVTSAVFAAGWLIFGISSYRARIFPRGASILMMLGGLVGAGTLLIGFQIPLALAVGWIGLWLIRSGSRELQPARSTIPMANVPKA
jgi:hypothetical protein